MRTARLSAGLILALITMYLQAQQPEQKITLTRKAGSRNGHRWRIDRLGPRT